MPKKKYTLPQDYDKLTQYERREVRLQYIEEQNNLCMYCNSPLDQEPPEHIKKKKILWKLFPANF